jgi:hypothetical protein
MLSREFYLELPLIPSKKIILLIKVEMVLNYVLPNFIF